jgi:integrase/recombinase XerD
MTPLRQKMLELMRTRNYSARTIEIYVYWIGVLARHFGQSPDQLSAEDLEAFQVWLRGEKKASWSGFNQALSAMRFFYREVLGRDELMDRLKYARRERSLPVVLSLDEVEALLGGARNLRELTCLSLLYGCGLRIGELLHLRVDDIDSSRGLIRVRRGKGTRTGMCRCQAPCSSCCASTGMPITRGATCFPVRATRPVRSPRNRSASGCMNWRSGRVSAST